MKDLELAKPAHQTSKLSRAIKKPKEFSCRGMPSLDTEYPIDSIIVKSIKIQKLLEQSSRTLRRFSREVKSLNREIDQLFVPVVEEPNVMIDANGSEFYFMDHRQIFDQLLEYSDVSDAEEPSECNTSVLGRKPKGKKRRKTNKKAQRHKEQLKGSEVINALQDPNTNGTYNEAS